MKRYLMFVLSSIACLLWSSSACAEIKGKVDSGSIYMKIDILRDGNSIKELKLGGVGGNGTFVHTGSGFAVKPTFTVAEGNGTDYHQFGCGLGWYIPICQWGSFTPVVGGATSRMMTTTDFPPLGLANVGQRFQTSSFYVGGDLAVHLGKCFLVSGGVQYNWSQTSMDLGAVLHTDTSTTGPYAYLMVDYYLNKCWSLQVAGAFSRVISKEKDGTKGQGIRIGSAHTF